MDPRPRSRSNGAPEPFEFAGDHEQRVGPRQRVVLPASWVEHIRADPLQGSLERAGVYRTGRRYRRPSEWADESERRRAQLAEVPDEAYEAAADRHALWHHNSEIIPLGVRGDIPVAFPAGTAVVLRGVGESFLVLEARRPTVSGRRRGYDAPLDVSHTIQAGAPMSYRVFDNPEQFYKSVALVMGVHYGMFGVMPDREAVLQILREADTGAGYQPAELAQYAARWFQHGGPGDLVDEFDDDEFDDDLGPAPMGQMGGFPTAPLYPEGPFVAAPRGPAPLMDHGYEDDYSQLPVRPPGVGQRRPPLRRRHEHPGSVAGALDDLREARRVRRRGVGGPHMDDLREMRHGRRRGVGARDVDDAFDEYERPSGG